MVKMLKATLLLVLSFFVTGVACAQLVADPTTWSYEVKKKTGNEYELIFHLKLKEGWHIWSQDPKGDGFQIPPSFTFNANNNVKLKGKVKEKGHMVTGMVDGVEGEVNYYHGNVDFVQTVTVTGNTKITGSHEYQVCDDKMCLPPKKKKFSLDVVVEENIGGTSGTLLQKTIDSNLGDTIGTLNAGNVSNATLATTNTADEDYSKLTYDSVGVVVQNEEQKPTMFSLILKGIASGLFAVITPCVFAMLPMNVSFFLKRSKTRKKGIWTAIQYSISILLIFIVIGFLVALLPKNSFNNISTNWILNLVFFLVFLIFGISFLGAFEINLPSSWATKMDKRANTSSFLGIFFMALTLVIVSFSCTVPFIGGLLFLVQSSGSQLGPVVGFLGFGIGLALPFTLFAIFPTLLNEFGKSGGWLNAVKVTFGIIELALALKFLSNADLAKGWRLLDREVFLSLWIALSIILGLYLIGVLRFSHDSELPKNDWGLPYLKVPRLFFAIAAFSFAFYLIPGMWGAPLNGMSALLPPPGTQDFILNGNSSSANTEVVLTDEDVKPNKYVSDLRTYEPLFVTQNGIDSYFDYFEALRASRKMKKPIMLDFTGINCANCRKMESQVLSNPKVAEILKKEFIIASLYCDFDKKPLPENERFFSNALNGDVETLGDLNEHVQAVRYRANSQPFYFFVDETGHRMVPEGYQYDPNIGKFIDHLNTVLENYKKTHP